MTNNKLSIKLAEVAVHRFNNPTSGVPHHVALLAGHRANVERCVSLGEWDKIRREQINAARVMKQLKSMLVEMAELRGRIRDEDVAKYDEQVRPGRERALAEMNAYLQIDLKNPVPKRKPNANLYSHGDDANDDQYNEQQQQQQQQQIPAIQCDFNSTAYQLHTQTTCLRELESIHRDVADLNGIFHRLNETVAVQADAVHKIAENVDDSQVAVVQGERHLRQALTYKKAIYPMAGALLGTCLGGPVGMLAGLKMGGIAAVGCGILGFTGGSAIKNSEEQQQRQQQQLAEGEAAQDAGLILDGGDADRPADRKND